MTLDLELKERAKDLYIVEELTLVETARATGISEHTLKNWSAAEGWREKREERRRRQEDIDRTKELLRQKLADMCVEKLDPQYIYALVRLEKAAQASRKKTDLVAAPEIDRPKIFLEDMEFIVETLKEIDPQGLKVLGRNFETIVRRFKERHEAQAQTH